MDKKSLLLLRIATYTVLLAALTGVIIWNYIPREPLLTDDYSQLKDLDSVKLFQEYLRIDTAWPDADTRDAVRFWQEKFAEIGITPKINRVGPKNFNVVVTIPGGPKPPLILHHHMDVNAIKHPDLWRFPPFSGQIEGYYLYGRGSIDMKNYGIIYYLAIKKALEEKWHLDRPVTFIATPTEENEMNRGIPWLREHHPELFPRGSIFLTEGGSFESIAGHLVYWGILTYQKEWIIIRVPGLDSERKKSLSRRLAPLFPGDKLILFPEYASMLKKIAPHRIAYRDILQKITTLYRDNRDKLFNLPEPYLTLMRREFFIQDHPVRGRCLILSLLPGDNTDDYLKRVEEILNEEKIHYTTLFISPKLSITPSDTPVFRTLEKTVKEVFPTIDAGPYPTPWKMNEGQFMRTGEFTSYGITLVPADFFEMTHMGAVNERVDIRNFVKGVTLGEKILENLTSDNF